MTEEVFAPNRSLKRKELSFDFVVAGGGITGVCAAIAAARNGIKVALVQDRPVLGGNGSSEVRVWMLGATSHMGNNNRWAREGGLLDEILVENLYRNKEGNPVLFDMVLIDKVLAEKNISLFLNTVITKIEKDGNRRIKSVTAYNSQNQTEYVFNSYCFCDSTGDGLIGFLSGATFRMGAEEKEMYKEKFVQDADKYGEKLGHSILFYVKDTGKPVKYVAPDFALSVDEVQNKINRINNPNYFKFNQYGCKYWWIEYGGRLDTVADTEEIKYKLWSVLYGIWNYIKNSGKYPEAENYTLEWAGLFPGKRDSRRFIGYTVLTQQDIIEQRYKYDAVAFGGWSIDLHPADGVFSDSKNACNQWHSKGVYPIPYRCYITPDVENLFLGGRIISVSHVANGSTRVMATAAAGGEAIGTAASICVKDRILPNELAEPDRITDLQRILVKNGAYLPQLDIELPDNKISSASLESSSVLKLEKIPFNGEYSKLKYSVAQMIPLKAGGIPEFTVNVDADSKTTLNVELRISSKQFNHTPDVTLDKLSFELNAGLQNVSIKSDKNIEKDCYLFLCFMSNDNVSIQFSETRITGLVTVYNKILPEVSNWGKQESHEDIGVENFEFWCPERRPGGKNIAMSISPVVDMFGVENLRNAKYRPVFAPNAWIAELEDDEAFINVSWNDSVDIHNIILYADNDYDHAMEPIQWGHPENRIPFCVSDIIVYDSNGNKISEAVDNHNTIIKLTVNKKISTDRIKIVLKRKNINTPISLFGIYIN